MYSERGPTERRVVTVLFVDMVGSTSLAEGMDPEDWSEVVRRALSVIAPCVERYGGSIVEFAGDSILALFGAPTAHEDDPYRAVRSALDILDAVDELGRRVQREMDVTVRVRAGINTGLVVAGGLSAGDLTVYTALGDTSNVAARMQALAEPGSLVISEATHRLVSADVDAEPLGATTVKGKSEAIPVHRVTGVRGGASRMRGIPGFTSPMVGRDEELASLASLVDAADAGRGTVAAIVGEPGVGKSRLLAEIRGRLEETNGARLVVGRCASYDQERPYHLIASLLRSIIGAGDSDQPEAVGSALRRSLEPLSGDSHQSVDRLLQLLGVEGGHQDDKPEVLRDSYARALVALISRVAERHRPLVLACEDIHWADASSADLLLDALRDLLRQPVLVVLLSRPDRDSHGWRILEGARRERGEALVEVRLGPLEGGESRRLVANLLEIDALPGDLRDAVLERAEGNPLFLEEFVRMLIERELIERVDGRWVARRALSDFEVPATLQGLLAARVDMLPGPAQRTARVASVVGRRFEARLLDDIVPRVRGADASGSVSAHVAELEASGFLRLAATRPQLAFIFRHALIHEVIYGSILRSDRRRLHRHVAQAIEAHHQGRLDEVAADLARHYTEARMPERAVHHLMAAGRQALARHARYEACDFFTRAAAQLDEMDNPPDRLRVEAALGRAQAGQVFIPASEVIAMLDGSVEPAERLGDADLTARLQLERLQTWETMGLLHSPEARAAAENLFALEGGISDRGVLGRLKAMMAWERQGADDLPAAAARFEEAVAYLEAADRPSEASMTAGFLADVLATMGRFADAEEWIARGAELAERSGDPNAIADNDLSRGRVASERGHLEEALEYTHRGTERAEAAGNVKCTLAGNFFAGEQELRRGHADAALSHLGKSSELAAYCRAGPFEMLGAVWLATARARLGDVDPSRFDGPLAQARQAGSRMSEGLVRFQRGIALSGDETLMPEALDDLSAAAGLFDEIGARPLHARALHIQAQVLDAAGDHREAATLTEQAAALFEELGIRPDREWHPAA